MTAQQMMWARQQAMRQATLAAAARMMAQMPGNTGVASGAGDGGAEDGPVPSISPTILKFQDGTEEEYKWSGEINKQIMTDAELYDEELGTWIKYPVDIIVGASVTSIGSYTFAEIENFKYMTIPSSVTAIAYNAIANCRDLVNVTFEGFTKDEVKELVSNTKIFGDAFYEPSTGGYEEKTFTVTCIDGSMTIIYNDLDITINDSSESVEV